MTKHKKEITKKPSIVKLIISIVICQLAGAIGAIFTTPKIGTWYAALHKPLFNPPNWIFGPVWITLYTLMGIALYLVWESKKSKKQALQIFGLQLALNALWSMVFFGAESILFGLVVIILLWLAILWMIVKFWKIDERAGWFLVPYIVWVTIATALNAGVWLLN